MRRTFRAGAFAILLCLPAGTAEAQWWSFEGRRYYDPLLAGVRDAHTSALALALADRFEFQIEDDEWRQVWDIDVGAELPIFGWESGPGVSGRAGAGEIGAGLWFAIDFHMIEDFVDPSAPVINTDYRFSGIGKVQYGLSATRWIAARVQVGHESTHLGDEFSIRGQEAHPDSFERINVSWEYLDLSSRYESQGGKGTSAVAVGVTMTVPFSSSYYSTGPASTTLSPIGPVIESRNWYDPYFGLEYRQDVFDPQSTGWLGRWGWYGSLEGRYRTVYDYHRADADLGEDRQLSLNLLAGVQKVAGRFERVSPFLRLYHGVNPHGQFRNQKDFTLVGLGVRLVP